MPKPQEMSYEPLEKAHSDVQQDVQPAGQAELHQDMERIGSGVAMELLPSDEAELSEPKALLKDHTQGLPLESETAPVYKG